MQVQQKLIAAVLSLSLLAQTSAFADGLANANLYVLGGIGASVLKDAEVKSFNANGTANTSDAEGFAWRLGAGVQATDYLGAEVGYVHFNEVSSSADDINFDASVQSFLLLGTVRYPFQNGFVVSAKAGAAYNNVDVSASIGLPNFSFVLNGSNSEWDFAYALGGAYNFNPTWSAQLEWLQVSSDIGALMANIVARF